jgi:hypothetical protein
MNLIKPPLWQEQATACQDTIAPAEGSPAGCPSRRHYPLAARTAALLQRLKAQGETGASHIGTSPKNADCQGDADLNRVQLSGTLGSEPLLYIIGDHPVAELSLACQRRWRTPASIWKVETTWFNLSASDELAEQCGRLLHRGDRVYVEGSLRLWAELRGPHSYGCHIVALDRIVLLVASRCDEDGA